MLNRWVLSRDRKTAAEGAEVTRSSRLFQTRAAATGKARSPTVESRVRLTISDEDEVELLLSSCCDLRVRYLFIMKIVHKVR